MRSLASDQRLLHELIPVSVVLPSSPPPLIQEPRESSGSRVGMLLTLASGSPCKITCSVTESSNLLDEDRHLVLFDGAGVVLVEFGEAGVEVILREFTTIRSLHVAEGLLNESHGLVLVEGSGVVLVVLSPDVVYALLDDSVDVSAHY